MTSEKEKKRTRRSGAINKLRTLIDGGLTICDAKGTAASDGQEYIHVAKSGGSFQNSAGVFNQLMNENINFQLKCGPVKSITDFEKRPEVISPEKMDLMRKMNLLREAKRRRILPENIIYLLKHPDKLTPAQEKLITDIMNRRSKKCPSS